MYRYLLLLLALTQVSFSEVDLTDGVLKRTKRSAALPCHAKYQALTTNHTACLPLSASATQIDLTSAEKTEILTVHNQFRGQVEPPATNMLKLVWDEELAEIARSWAGNCVREHDKNEQRVVPGRFTSGQSYYASVGTTSWTTIITAYKNEVQYFVYGDAAAVNSSKTGHYTQLTWATTRSVGCGAAHCDVEPFAYHFYVCNYGPSGNTKSTMSTPYKNGTRCADCPDNCVNDLCDCGDKVCLNGKELLVDTCTCDCKPLWLYIGDTCTLDCSANRERNYCNNNQTGFIESNCKVSNVPFECPHMCHWCPYADPAYSTSTAATTLSGGVSSTTPTGTTSIVSTTTPAETTSIVSTTTPAETTSIVQDGTTAGCSRAMDTLKLLFIIPVLICVVLAEILNTCA